MTSTLTTDTATSVRPTLGRIVRHSGIAGQYALSVLVTYPGELGTVVTFTGSTYGGPIVMQWPGFPRGIFVADEVMDRCGRKLSPEWVRRFYGTDTGA
jgi:hypothetical protein